jgi:hypothetical protein
MNLIGVLSSSAGINNGTEEKDRSVKRDVPYLLLKQRLLICEQLSIASAFI